MKCMQMCKAKVWRVCKRVTIYLVSWGLGSLLADHPTKKWTCRRLVGAHHVYVTVTVNKDETLG